MNKTKVEEIVFDGDISRFSQLRLAEWMIIRKKRVYGTDIKTTINGFEMDTIGCDDTQDFVDKYQHLFEQMELPNYDIRKVESENFTNICIDNLGTLTTKDCTSIEDFLSTNHNILSILSPEEQNKYIQIASSFITKQNNADIDINQTPVLEQQEPQKDLDNQLMQLIEDKLKLERSLKVLEKYKAGELNNQFQTVSSYAERKAKLEQEMEMAKNNSVNLTLEEVQAKINRLDTFIVDETVKNNSAMPLYNKAMQTREAADISRAIEAVNQLDDSHMYKVPLKEALSALVKESGLTIDYEPLDVKNKRKLEEAQATINRLNTFIVDETVKNNSAMPLYNKAMQTRESADISRAIEAVNQLDDSHMYKVPLKEALSALVKESGLTIDHEQLDVKNKRMLEEAQATVNRLNTFIVDETVKNNSAMPLYNKAMQTRESADILRAIEAVNQLDDSHMYKNPMMTALEAMIQVIRPGSAIEDLKNEKMFSLLSELLNSTDKVKRLQEEYEKVVKEEQDTIEYVEPIQAEKQQELDSINKEIERIKQEIEKSKTTDNQPLTKETSNESVNNNLAGSSSPTAMLPQQPLEDDYYKRLENAANEGPIFHETEPDYDITPKEEKPHIIKSIKKASSNLKNKIRNSIFAKKAADILEYIRKHKIKTAITIGAMLAGIGIAGAVQSNNKTEQDNQVAIEQEISNSEEVLNNTEDNAKIDVDTDIVANQIVEEKAEEQQLNEALKDTINNILDGENVYRTAANANSDTNSRETTESHRENSWAHATANTFYDSNSEVISRDEAEKIIADGGEVVARFDNNGTHIGFAKVSQPISEVTSEKSM